MMTMLDDNADADTEACLSIERDGLALLFPHL
jgi:hypothetical protein